MTTKEEMDDEEMVKEARAKGDLVDDIELEELVLFDQLVAIAVLDHVIMQKEKSILT